MIVRKYVNPTKLAAIGETIDIAPQQIASLRVDNQSPNWYFLVNANRFISPFTSGEIIGYSPTAAYETIRAQLPPGIGANVVAPTSPDTTTNPVLPDGLLVLTAYDYPQPEQTGIPYNATSSALPATTGNTDLISGSDTAAGAWDSSRTPMYGTVLPATGLNPWTELLQTGAVTVWYYGQAPYEPDPNEQIGNERGQFIGSRMTVNVLAGSKICSPLSSAILSTANNSPTQRIMQALVGTNTSGYVTIELIGFSGATIQTLFAGFIKAASSIPKHYGPNGYLFVPQASIDFPADLVARHSISGASVSYSLDMAY